MAGKSRTTLVIAGGLLLAWVGKKVEKKIRERRQRENLIRVISENEGLPLRLVRKNYLKFARREL